MPAHRIILDCDPGRDDALAIALALAAPAEIELLGITTVAGNVPLALTQRNARLVCELCGRPDVKVYAGAERPLTRDLVTAEIAHGRTGLDGIAIREPALPLQDQGAVDYLIETLRASADDGITLVAVGPLTNLALAFDTAPAVLAKVRRIVIMGGAWRAGGNVTPTAEFNIYVDPEAAARVFACGRPLVIFGLDVTHQVRAQAAEADRLVAVGTAAARTFSALLRPPEGRTGDGPDGSGVALHDPCTIAWLIAPDLFETEAVRVTVDTEDGETLGQTRVDPAGAANAQWVYRADAPAVFDLLINHIGRL